MTNEPVSREPSWFSHSSLGTEPSLWPPPHATSHPGYSSQAEQQTRRSTLERKNRNKRRFEIFRYAFSLKYWRAHTYTHTHMYKHTRTCRCSCSICSCSIFLLSSCWCSSLFDKLFISSFCGYRGVNSPSLKKNHTRGKRESRDSTPPLRTHLHTQRFLFIFQLLSVGFVHFFEFLSN